MNKSITASCLIIVIFSIIGFWHYGNIKNEAQNEFNLLKHPISVIYKNQEGMRYHFSSIKKGEYINKFYEEQLMQNGWNSLECKKNLDTNLNIIQKVVTIIYTLKGIYY